MKAEEYNFETLSNHAIYEVITGSHSYGLNIETSDKDVKGIVVLPKDMLFTLGDEWETTSYSSPDVEYHSLRKFMRLASNQNPTILEMLYVDPEFIAKSSPAADLLRENRHLFLSANCYYTYGGYAQQQLMKLKNGLDKATKDDHNNHLRYTVENIIKGFDRKYSSFAGNNLDINDIVFDENEKQQLYLDIKFEQIPITELSGMISEIQNAYKGYTKLTNRNKKSEDKLGKHAMHLVRLFQCGVEVLETGYIQVKRDKDRDFLLSIRNGDFDWNEVFSMVKELEGKLKSALNNTELPKRVDYKKINNLYKEIMLNSI